MTGLRVAGLFAGIGGIELGLERAGHSAVLLNELDPSAHRVLRQHFPEPRHTDDIRELKRLPRVDLVSAGFPCTDISQAGKKAGIGGVQSGLVNEVFRLVEDSRVRPEFLLLENVSYLLNLAQGAGVTHLIEAVERLGYRWAYRVVDARAFGLPQRRQRIVFLAARSHDPRTVLFADESHADPFDDRVGAVDRDSMYGFYWTEGLRGLGWVKDAVPTIKGGSGLGIPSAPALWTPSTNEFGTPEIEDGERMQGFPVDWTLPHDELGDDPPVRPGTRWKQVGNAVCVPMSTWIGERLAVPGDLVDGQWDVELSGRRLPAAAYGHAGRVFVAPVSTQPFQREFRVRKFLDAPLRQLSSRAALGFLSRARRSTSLRFAEGFLEGLDDYVNRQL